MKILLLSFHFPPDAPLAATRAPKLARYLLGQGHDVMVLCASDPQPLVTHRLEIDKTRIVRTEWRDLRAVPDQVLGHLRPARQAPAAPSPAPPDAAKGAAAPSAPSLKRRLGAFYEAAVCRPDGRIGWAAYACDAARCLFQSWQPDLVYATCPPHSTAVIADRIARECGVPLVAEFRDRWALDAYSDHPDWRQALDRRQEADILSRAAGIVTVSPLWTKSYIDRYPGTPVATVMNGFDASEYPASREGEASGDGAQLEILYAGALYPGRRDPGALLKAIAQLGPDSGSVRLTMLGKDLDAARAIAAREGVASCLEILPPEPHTAIVERQYRADALLLLQWDNPRDAGTVPGKLFECIGARRPVIATGYADGVVAGIIRERQLGLLSNDPAEIAAHLRGLLATKRENGFIPSLPASVRADFERHEQFSALDPFLSGIFHAPAHLRAAE